MAEVRVAKFCVQVEYIKCWPLDDRLESQNCNPFYSP